jgi:hypothetical protein
MSQNLTNGFDIVTTVSEPELNRQLAMTATNGSFPVAASIPFGAAGVTGTLQLNFATPTLDLDAGVANGIRLFVPFVNSQIQITTPPITASPLAGTIQIVDRVGVLRQGSTRRVRVDFTDGVDSLQIVFTPDTQTLLQNIGAPFVTVDQVRTAMEQQVLGFLSANIRELPLSPDIALSSDPLNPPSEVDIRVINDTSAADRDCLAYLLQAGGAASSGNPNGFTVSLIPSGQAAILLLSNDFVLRRVVCPLLEQRLNLTAADFNPPCELARPRTITLPDVGEVELRILRVIISGQLIVAECVFGQSGTGYDVEVSFHVDISLSLQSGVIVLNAVPSEPDVDIDLAWWVYLLGAFTFGTYLGAVWATIFVIVAAIVDAILDGVADALFGDLVGNRLQQFAGELARFPLGPLAKGISISSISLDDLMIVGAPLLSEDFPIASEGDDRTLTPGQAFDLDSGEVRTPATGAVVRFIDIVWRSEAGQPVLRTLNGAAIALLPGASFAALTPIELERAPYGPSGGVIMAAQIPLAQTAPANVLVFAVRTSQARFAKCAVWRDSAGTLHLRYVTYNRPTPSLSISDRWDVINERKIGEGTESYVYRGMMREAKFELFALEQRGEFRALARLMAYPIDFQWCLAGQILTGDGSVLVHNTRVRHSVDRDRCTLLTALGNDLKAQLCVSAIDARGLELFTCTLIDRLGTDKRSQALVDVRELRQLAEDLGRLQRLADDLMQSGGGIGGPIGPDPGPPLSQLDTNPGSVSV